MSKNLIIIAALVIVALGAVVFYLPANKSMTSAPAAGQGKLVVGISDETAIIERVNSVMVTVGAVEVQSAAQGWVTVSSAPKRYDLLQLKKSGAVALLADANIPVGTYDQIRLTISKVEITASGVTQEAKLPSGMLKITGRLVIEEGKTATAVLDFKADKSLHMTGNGKFILAPVVHLQTKSDVSVQERPDHTLKIDGGREEHEIKVGMDERGEVRENFELDVDAKIEIDVEDVIHVTGKNEEDRDDKDDEDDKNEHGQEVKLNLSAQNNSGIAGTATFDDEDGKVEVKLKLAGVSTGVLGLLGISIGATHPAHIHQGSCASIGAVKYPLASTAEGESKTTVNASLADLKTQLPLAINVHKSSEEMGVYVACADIRF